MLYTNKDCKNICPNQTWQLSTFFIPGPTPLAQCNTSKAPHIFGAHSVWHVSFMWDMTVFLYGMAPLNGTWLFHMRHDLDDVDKKESSYSPFPRRWDSKLVLEWQFILYMAFHIGNPYCKWNGGNLYWRSMLYTNFESHLLGNGLYRKSNPYCTWESSQSLFRQNMWKEI